MTGAAADVLATDPRDGVELRDWLAWCAQHPGRLPPSVVPVQTRLIRAVGRGVLRDHGAAFVKVMGFPRARDRWRYRLRALPAEHEARMLAAAAAAAVPCPRVLGVVATRGPWRTPRASALVTAALDVAPKGQVRLAQAASVIRRLADAGIWHPDLHERNFVLLANGGHAVLDLQSAQRRRRALAHSERLALAARLLAADWPVPECPQAVAEGGLVAAGDLGPALLRAQGLRVDAVRRRVGRCLQDSTEFVSVRQPWGVGLQRRTFPAGGSWHHGGRELIRAWIGARYGEVVANESPQLGVLFLNSWWLPRRCSVYSPVADGVAPFRERCARWLDAYARFKDMTSGSRPASALSVEMPLPWTGHREV